MQHCRTDSFNKVVKYIFILFSLNSSEIRTVLDFSLGNLCGFILLSAKLQFLIIVEDPATHTKYSGN